MMSRQKNLHERNAAMAMDRARGLTLREIAARHGLSLTQVYRIVGNVTISPPAAQTRLELVSLPGGGFTYRIITLPPPRPRAYWVRGGRHVYPGTGNFPKISG